LRWLSVSIAVFRLLNSSGLHSSRSIGSRKDTPPTTEGPATAYAQWKTFAQ
jgi:hypothetical protein